MADAQLACGPARQGGRLSVAPVAELTDAELLERFTRARDERAFALLVERHGPLVWSVCRRILGSAQDAEDAFQATFLVLVRRADSLQNPELLGSWLYGVASRTARKARAQAGRRQRQERQATPVATETEPTNDLAWRELRQALDEELEKLPEKYRLPLVLCYLQGLTNEEAARRLRWPSGSMSYRLARGREMLRERMERRRRLAPAGFFSLALVLGVGSGELSARLLEQTTQLAKTATASGPAAAVTISENVRALAEATLRSLPAPAQRRWWRSLLPLGLAVFIALTLSMLVGFADNLSLGQSHRRSASGAASNDGMSGIPLTVGSSGANDASGPAQPSSIPRSSCHGQ
ncbi:MAG TPA: sigma-70 family RNA polymerase sigma factor [Gemmataceae bacterium]|nr:sigma-70 family RNA polymerase sigma factor [Gemmataceae bacterium]